MSQKNSAILVMDMQSSVISRYENANKIFTNIQKVIEQARVSKLSASNLISVIKTILIIPHQLHLGNL